MLRFVDGHDKLCWCAPLWDDICCAGSVMAAKDRLRNTSVISLRTKDIVEQIAPFWTRGVRGGTVPCVQVLKTLQQEVVPVDAHPVRRPHTNITRQLIS